jgi:hypothetical protein
VRRVTLQLPVRRHSGALLMVPLAGEAGGELAFGGAPVDVLLPLEAVDGLLQLEQRPKVEF